MGKKEIVKEDCVYCFTYEGHILMSNRNRSGTWRPGLKTKKVYTSKATAEYQLREYVKFQSEEEKLKYGIGKLILAVETQKAPVT